MATRKGTSKKTAAGGDAQKVKTLKELLMKSIRDQQESLHNLELAIRETEKIDSTPYGEPCPGFRLAPWTPARKSPGKKKE